MVTRKQMQRKSIDNDILNARVKLIGWYGGNMKRLTFGKIRADGTRSAKIIFHDDSIRTFSYLTDIPNRNTGIEKYIG